MRGVLKLLVPILAVVSLPAISEVVPPADTLEPVRLTVEECVEIGLSRNPRIEMAEAKVDQAEGQTMQARSNLYPSLDLTGNVVRSNKLPDFAVSDPTLLPTSFPAANPGGGLVPGLPAHIHFLPFPGFEISNTREGDIYGVKVEAQYALYTGNRVQNGVKAAELNEEVAEQELRQERIELIFNIKQSFYGVLLAQEMVKVVDQAYDNAAAHFKQVRDLFNEGLVSNLDVIQVEAILAQIRPQQVQARNGVKMARLGLNNYLAIDLETVVEAQGELKYEPHQLPLPEDLYSLALINRPEMEIMRLRKKMAKKNLEIAEANASPTVALFANYSWDKGQEMPPNDTIWRDGYQAGVAVTVPLFDGRATEGKVEEALAMMRQVDYGMEALSLGIRTQVQQSILSLKAAEELVQAMDANVAASAKAHDVAKARYSVGLATNLEVMDAQTQLTRARAERLQAVYDYNLAWLNLQVALGLPDEEYLK